MINKPNTFPEYELVVEPEEFVEDDVKVVGPATYSLPRHRVAFGPSFLELHGILPRQCVAFGPSFLELSGILPRHCVAFGPSFPELNGIL